MTKKRGSGGGGICQFVSVAAACVGVQMRGQPTCSRADKLQNQRPASDNAGSAGQKVPVDKQPITMRHSGQR